MIKNASRSAAAAAAAAAKVEVTNRAAFEAAKMIGSSDRNTEGKYIALSKILKEHVGSMNHADASAWFMQSPNNGNGGGKAIRLDVLNGYSAGRGWKSYELAGDTEKATARKAFQRVLAILCPKPSPEKNTGGAVSGEVARANTETSKQESRGTQGHADSNLGNLAGVLFSFVNGAAIDMLESLKSGKSIPGGRLATFASALAAAQDAAARLSKTTNVAA